MQKRLLLLVAHTGAAGVKVVPAATLAKGLPLTEEHVEDSPEVVDM